MDSQIIHEAMGLCWHRWRYITDNPKQGRIYGCTSATNLCNGTAIGEDECTANPDYTDPTSYLEAMAWAKNQEWFEDFLHGHKYNSNRCEGVSRTTLGLVIDMLDPKLGSHALASYLEGREG